MFTSKTEKLRLKHKPEKPLAREALHFLVSTVMNAPKCINYDENKHSQNSMADLGDGFGGLCSLPYFRPS